MTTALEERALAYDRAVADVRDACTGLAPAHAGVDAMHARMRAVVDALWTRLAPVGVSWVGFYLPSRRADGVEELVLGPRRDKPACSPIGLHGVCGQAYRARATRVVGDVRDLGPNYVACDPRDQSEIVVPILAKDGCLAVLDLDSHLVGHFGETDRIGLEQVVAAAGFSGPR